MENDRRKQVDRRFNSGVDQQELEDLIQRAVKSAFKDVGLHDEKAGKDLAELRSLLEVWRDVKTTMMKAMTTAGTFFLLGLLSLGAWRKMNGDGGE